MPVRLTADQRQEVRRDIAARGAEWNEDDLAFRWAQDRARSDADFVVKATEYFAAILRYREWLVKNYRTVRAQARAA